MGGEVVEASLLDLVEASVGAEEAKEAEFVKLASVGLIFEDRTLVVEDSLKIPLRSRVLMTLEPKILLRASTTPKCL